MKLHQMYLFKCGKNPHLPFLIDFVFGLDWQNVKKRKRIRIEFFSKHSSFYFCKLNLPEFVNNISVLIIQRDCKRSIFFLAKVHGIFSWIIFEIHFSLHNSLWRLSTKKSWNHLHFTFACSTDQNINPNSEVSESCRSCHQKVGKKNPKKKTTNKRHAKTLLKREDHVDQFREYSSADPQKTWSTLQIWVLLYTR